MIHYSCDRCQRLIDAQKEVRYVVRIEVQAAVEPPDLDSDEAVELNELQLILDEMDQTEFDNLQKRAYRKLKFDLCDECHQAYSANPLALEASTTLGFSDN